MKVKNLTVLAFSIVFFGITSCGDNQKPELNTKAKNEKTEDDKAHKQAVKTSQEDFDNLKEYTNKDGFFDNFELQEDNVGDGGWYFYSNSSSKNESHIEVPFATNGFFYLKAHYTGKDWLFFKSITVSIGDKTYNSSTLSPGSSMKVEKIGGKGVYETAHFTLPSVDMDIVRLIAQNSDKEIIVRFNGDKTNYDLVLTKKDKQRIKDCYLMARFTTYQENETYQYIGDERNIENKILVTDHGVPTGDIKDVNYTK